MTSEFQFKLNSAKSKNMLKINEQLRIFFFFDNFLIYYVHVEENLCTVEDFFIC